MTPLHSTSTAQSMDLTSTPRRRACPSDSLSHAQRCHAPAQVCMTAAYIAPLLLGLHARRKAPASSCTMSLHQSLFSYQSLRAAPGGATFASPAACGEAPSS